VLAVERICSRTRDLVGTVGKVEALPGAVNVIPGKARVSLDVRALLDSVRGEAVLDLLAEFDAICKRRGVRVKVTKVHEGTTAACAPWLMRRMAAAIEAEGLRVRELPSGAGHDGMAIIALAPICMLFVRCEKGISHNPAEAITLQDVEVGTRVFLRFIEDFDPSRKS
jgi:allantoate deiminase